MPSRVATTTRATYDTRLGLFSGSSWARSKTLSMGEWRLRCSRALTGRTAVPGFHNGKAIRHNSNVIPGERYWIFEAVRRISDHGIIQLAVSLPSSTISPSAFIAGLERD